MVVFQIQNLKSEESTATQFAQIVANFASQSPKGMLKKLLLGHKDTFVSLEIALINQRIHFFLVCEEHLKTYFQSQLTSYFPKAKITHINDYLPNLESLPHTAFGQLVLKNTYYYPLQTYKTLKDSDPLTSILSILSKYDKAQTGLIQIIMQPAGTTWQSGAASLVEKGLTDPETGARKPLPNESLIKEKIASNGVKTSIRLLVSGNNDAVAKTMLNDLAGSFGVFSRGDGNRLTLKKPGFLNAASLKKSILTRNPKPTPKYQVLNTEEVATMFHIPGEQLSTIKNVSWGGSLLSEAPDNLPISGTDESEDVNFFARTEYKNEKVTFGIKRKDRRRHIYLIGKTGTGKSTLIANMAINDMRNGEGVAIIDPHGDLCEILLDYVPKKRINDVAYLDPSDTSAPFRLNPLEMTEGMDKAQAELVASGIVSIFYKLYSYSWGPRLEYLLRNALMTLTNVPNATLVDIPPLMSDPVFRKKIVNKLDDPVLINFWENEYGKMNDRLQSEAIAPILNKVGQFVSSPTIRNIIGYPKSTVDFTKMMDEGKIVICNLSQGKLGEDNAALLGAMFITKMQLSAMSRVYKKEEDRRDFYLYVDEFQNFATKSFNKILSEARKYRLNLILANQYIGQIDEDVKKAIFGNVGTTMSFLVGAHDARQLSFEYGKQYEEKDFVSLDNFQLLIKMAINGRTSTPFHAYSLPLPKNKGDFKEKVIRVSKSRYGKKKKQVNTSGSKSNSNDNMPPKSPKNIQKT